MIVKVNYRKPKRKSPIKWMIFTFCGMFLGIMAFSFSSEDDFLYLYNLNNQVLQKTKVYQLVSNQYEDWGGDEDQMPAYNTGGTTTATSGTGLNLLLINNIQTEGYVKEYLTIAAENQEGKLDTTERERTATVQAIIGINVAESKCYEAGDNWTLPKQDLPQGSDGAPRWDGGTYSLKRWGVDDHNREGFSDFGGPLQYASAGKITVIYTKSKYNTGTSTGGGQGDCYNFGDTICGLNDYMINGCAAVGIDYRNVDNDVALLSTVISHNRGPGGLSMIYGASYKRINNDGPWQRQYLNSDALSEEDNIQLMQNIYDSIVNTENGNDYDTIETIGEAPMYALVLIPMVSSGWYLSDDAKKQIMKYESKYNGVAVRIWNTFMPNEQVSDAASLENALAKHTSKLSTVLGISDADCDRIYGTYNGTYPTFNAKANSSDVFYVNKDKTTNMYKNGSNMPVVQAMESLCAQHIYQTFKFSSIIYAKMLKYAGVDVDPTNPDTYMNKFSGDGWSSVSTEYQDVLKANGLDTSKLTDERAKIVNVAASYLGTKYLQCRNGGGQDGALCDGFCYNNMDAKATHLDCSAFIWRCYKEAGFDCTGFPTNTGGYTTNDGVLVETTVDQLKPGDVIWFSHGHVELYLGQDDSTIYYIHESTWGVGCVYGTHRKEGFPGKGCKLYRYTRFENE